jgi:hypothetical protein
MNDQEINEAVARKLGKDPDGFTKDYSNYCHDIAAAWSIVERLKEHSISLYLADPSAAWFCAIFPWDGVGGDEHSKRKGEVEAEAETAPKAICKAFLKL